MDKETIKDTEEYVVKIEESTKQLALKLFTEMILEGWRNNDYSVPSSTYSEEVDRCAKAAIEASRMFHLEWEWSKEETHEFFRHIEVDDKTKSEEQYD